MDANKRIVPVVVRDVTATAVPPELAKRNWLFLRDEDDFEAGVDTLVTTLDTDLDRVRSHSKLLVRAREWSVRDDRSLLLRGSELADAESVIGVDADPRATPDQTRFVVASRQAATRRQRGAIAITTVVALVAATMGVFAWTQRSQAIEQRQEAETERERAEQQANVADSRRLAIQALSTFDTQPGLGASLAIEAYRTAATPEATDALHLTAQRSLGLDRLLPAGGSVEIGDIDFDPTGKRIASVVGDSLFLWDVARGQLVGEPFGQGQGKIGGIDFDPSGSLLAATPGREVVIWRLGDENQVAARFTPATPPFDVAFSPDGRTLAVAGRNGTLSLYKRDRWKLIWATSLAGSSSNANAIDDIAFDPGGERIAATVGRMA